MDQDIIAKQLQEKLTDLEQRLRRVNQDAGQSHSADFAEQAQERENDEVIDAIGDESDKSIRQIKKALQRLEEGKYGICTQCNNEIDPKRLAAVPESTVCLSCLSS
jgi:RNA polymerase-binding transcription factor DksA